MKNGTLPLYSVEESATEFKTKHPSADGVWTHMRLLPGALASGESIAGEVSMVVQQGHIAWLGASADLPTHFDTLAHHDGGGALLGPAWWTATPIWFMAASAPTNLPCAWRGPVTKTWPVRAGASCRQSRPRAKRPRTRCWPKPPRACKRCWTKACAPSKSSQATAWRWRTNASNCAWPAAWGSCLA
jgi:hypothetical protein